MLEEQLVLARWALYLVLGLLFGLPLFRLYAQGRDAPASLPFRPILTVLALAGSLLSIWGFLSITANMTGTAPLSVDRGTLGMVLSETSVGWALIVRLLALLVVLALAAVSTLRGRGALAGTTLAAGTAVASLAWGGHAVATEGLKGTMHLVGDIAHLLAASAWIGALTAFLWATAASVRRRTGATEAAHHALAGFAASGSIIVAVLVLTGVINGAMLVGVDHVGTLATSTYGRLLLIKLALFVAMLALAATNRFRLTPALRTGIADGTTDAAFARLRRSLLFETGAGVAILAIVAWMGTLPPPALG